MTVSQSTAEYTFVAKYSLMTFFPASSQLDLFPESLFSSRFSPFSTVIAATSQRHFEIALPI